MTNPFADEDGDGDGDGIFNCARTTGSEPGSAGDQHQAMLFALNQRRAQNWSAWWQGLLLPVVFQVIGLK